MQSLIEDTYVVDKLFKQYGVIECYANNRDVLSDRLELYILLHSMDTAVTMTFEMTTRFSHTKNCYFSSNHRDNVFYNRELIWRKGVWYV